MRKLRGLSIVLLIISLKAQSQSISFKFYSEDKNPCLNFYISTNKTIIFESERTLELSSNRIQLNYTGDTITLLFKRDLYISSKHFKLNLDSAIADTLKVNDYMVSFTTDKVEIFIRNILTLSYFKKGKYLSLNMEGCKYSNTGYLFVNFNSLENKSRYQLDYGYYVPAKKDSNVSMTLFNDVLNYNSIKKRHKIYSREYEFNINSRSSKPIIIRRSRHPIDLQCTVDFN